MKVWIVLTLGLLWTGSEARATSLIFNSPLLGLDVEIDTVPDVDRPNQLLVGQPLNVRAYFIFPYPTEVIGSGYFILDGGNGDLPVMNNFGAGDPLSSTGLEHNFVYSSPGHATVAFEYAANFSICDLDFGGICLSRHVQGLAKGSFAFDVVETTTSLPLPAALPLFATGIGVLGLIGWRRKRKAAALATA